MNTQQNEETENSATGNGKANNGVGFGGMQTDQPQEADGSILGLLRQLSQGDPTERLTMRTINAVMADRAFGILLLLFTLPNCFPIPGPPGLSLITGLPVVFFAFQLAWGARYPWLPRWIEKRSLTRGTINYLLIKGGSWLRPIEKLIQPRLPFFTRGRAERVVGLVALVLAVLLSLPILFGNFLPAAALAILSLGLIERDGFAIMCGYLASLIALVWVGVLLWTGTDILVHFLRWLHLH